MNSTSPVSVRRDPLAVIAFVLAVFLMIVPVEADILHPLFLRGHFGLAALVAAFFSAIVFTPYFLAVRRRRREPQAWSGRGFLIATGVILVLNIIWFCCIIIFQFFR
jgi:hypothetical protein